MFQLVFEWISQLKFEIVLKQEILLGFIQDLIGQNEISLLEVYFCLGFILK